MGKLGICLSLVALVGAFAYSGCKGTSVGGKRPSGMFESQIKPILEHRCLECHARSAPSGGLNFQDREPVMAAFRNGKRLIVPGDPDSSLLYTSVARPGEHPMMMPNDGWKLTQAQLNSLRVWIEKGAEWPDPPAGSLEKKETIIHMDEAP